MVGLCMWGCQVPAVTHMIVLALGIDLSHVRAGKLTDILPGLIRHVDKTNWPQDLPITSYSYNCQWSTSYDIAFVFK